MINHHDDDDCFYQVPLASTFNVDAKKVFCQEADINGDQHVSFEEFRDIFNEG